MRNFISHVCKHICFCEHIAYFMSTSYFCEHITFLWTHHIVYEHIIFCEHVIFLWRNRIFYAHKKKNFMFTSRCILNALDYLTHRYLMHIIFFIIIFFLHQSLDTTKCTNRNSSWIDLIITFGWTNIFMKTSHILWAQQEVINVHYEHIGLFNTIIFDAHHIFIITFFIHTRKYATHNKTCYTQLNRIHTTKHVKHTYMCHTHLNTLHTGKYTTHTKICHTHVNLIHTPK